MKDADADRKIQLYSVIDAHASLQHSKLLSNAHIDTVLRSLLDVHPAAINSFSLESRMLVQDAKQMMGTMRLTMQKKHGQGHKYPSRAFVSTSAVQLTHPAGYSAPARNELYL